MDASPKTPLALAQTARRRFVRHIAAKLPGLGRVVAAHLREQLDLPATLGEAQAHRDACQAFERLAPDWLARAQAALNALGDQPPSDTPPPAPGTAPAEPTEWSLLAEEAVEVQLLVARTALAASDRSAGVANDVRLRLQYLEGRDDLVRDDPVRAQNIAQQVVHAWLDAGLGRDVWLQCQQVLYAGLADLLAEAYRDVNGYLLRNDVLPEIDWRDRVRRAPDSGLPADDPATASAERAAALAPPPAGPVSGAVSARAADAVPAADVPARLLQFLSEQLPQSADWWKSHLPAAGAAPVQARAAKGAPVALATAPKGGAAGPATRTAGATGYAATQVFSAPTVLIDWNSLEQGVSQLRAEVRALKAAARSDQEKAIVEVVALIFDHILTEERIPATLRVWFARLQMPVLRAALVDPSFLASDQHPARLLIDRMGACVLGFEAGVALEPLEKEIKRIVQVIEQYPETGWRVFEMMHQEFQTFLAQHLRAPEQVERVVSLAQQVEQRETLAVTYAIELRKRLGQAVVRESVRDFLFQTWVEVMAQATVRYGAQEPQAQSTRQLVGDLLWAASAKAERHERAQVIAKVPSLLEQLRAGMALIGYDRTRQDAGIKVIRDALADAFMSRAAPVDAAWLNELKQQLAHLENLLPEAEVPDLEFNRDTLELITGVDASAITVLPNPPGAAEAPWRAAAAALALGDWFQLEHNGLGVSVQLAWHSEHRQFYLFVTPAQQSFLLQQGRVASYLQAGLLVPQQAEALTTRATRDALAKLNANPERLLA